MSQRAQVLRIIALATLPLVVLLLVAIWQDAAEGQARVAAERVALARAGALLVDAFLSDNLSTLRAIALMPIVQDPSDTAATGAVLARLAQENPDWEGVGIIDSDGWFLVGSRVGSGTINVADRPYFQQTLATGRPTVSPAVLGRIANVPTVPLAVPVELSRGGRGVLAAPLPTERLAAMLRTQLATDELSVALFDTEGQAVVPPDPGQGTVLTSLRGRPEVDTALAGQTGTRIVQWDGVETLVAHAPVPAYGWGVLVIEPTASAFAPVGRDVAERLVMLGLVVLLVAWIGWYFSGRLSLLYQRLVDARALAEAARTEAERARQDAAFLAEASQELAGSLDYAVTLGKVARLAVTYCADWCAVQIVEPDGSVHRVAAAHADPAKEPLVQALVDRHPPAPDSAHPVLRVLRSGRSELANDVPESFMATAVPDSEHRQILSALGLRAYMCVPMVARDHILGAITLVAAESGRRFGPTDLALAEDLARRAALAVDNARLHREVQEAVRTRDEFLAIASHDLKSPLTLVRATAQLLRRAVTQASEAAPERLTAGLTNIEAATTRMTHLIDTLLDVARLQSGRPLELERRTTDLAALVQRVAGEVQQSSERHEIRVEGPPTLVGHWDATRLERVVANLLDNAVKYSPDGGPITVGLAREDETAPWAVLSVRDPGLGIPSDDLPHIFERFHRGANVVGQIQGTGIGLAGARQIVEQHGGTIAVESTVGHGTTFTVRLPLTDEPDTA